MAKAEVIPVPKLEKVYRYRIDLTEEEAATLVAVGWRVGGNPNRSPRGHFDNISAALKGAGVPFKPIEYNFLTYSSSITFDDYTNQQHRCP